MIYSFVFMDASLQYSEANETQSNCNIYFFFFHNHKFSDRLVTVWQYKVFQHLCTQEKDN